MLSAFCEVAIFSMKRSLPVLMSSMKSFLKTLTLLFLGMYFSVVTIKGADLLMIMLL